nr:iron-sulfur cluster biosynthesis family protein [uncultured Bacillus sp.]
MFSVTESAKGEIQKRFQEFPGNKYVRLQMRFSCYMKLKLTVEKEVQPNDVEVTVAEIKFIIDKEHEHYFNGKVIDYAVNHTGFKEFDAVEPIREDS